MLNYFLNNNYDKTEYVYKKYTRFEYIQRRYKHDLDKVVNYYRQRERAVNNTHILSKLITNISPNIELNVIDYLKYVNATARFISKQFNITSNINYGQVHNNVFYGNNSEEIFIYVEKDIDLYDLGDNYDTICSITPVYIEDTDLDYYVPMGNKELRKPSLSVYEFDIVTMMLQYRYWCIDRLSNDQSVNPNVFVATIIIPNMVYKIFDLALWNRFVYINRGYYIPKFVIKQPFTLLSLEDSVDKIYKDINKLISNNDIPLKNLLENIPAVTSDTMNKVLELDISFYTSQSEWGIWLSRIFVIADILNIFNKEGMKRNTSLVNTLPVKMRALENRSTNIYGKLSYTIFNRYIDTIEKIKDLVGKR